MRTVYGRSGKKLAVTGAVCMSGVEVNESMQAVLSMVLRDRVRALLLIQRWCKFLNGWWSIQGTMKEDGDRIRWLMSKL